jgi:hypothetical protein
MSLRHLILHNFWLKMFSIAAGTIIWITIHYSKEHVLTFSETSGGGRLIPETVEVPISILQDEGDVRVFRIFPTNALVTVMGEARILRGPAGHEIKMYVDLTGYPSGAATQEDLHPDVPPSIHVVEFKPHTVSVLPANP